MPDDLYHRHILAWSEQQSERLRRVAAGERVNDVDRENVIEEIGSLGASELRAVRSLIQLALFQALNILAWPGHSARDHWRHEINSSCCRPGSSTSLAWRRNLICLSCFALPCGNSRKRRWTVRGLAQCPSAAP